MNLDGLLQKAKSGDMAAQYELAEYYGKLLKETENEDEIVRYSREAMIWLRKSAKQGYGPAVDAVKDLDEDDPDDLDAAAAATAAAVASAVEDFEGSFSASSRPPEATPLPIVREDDEDDDYDPFASGMEPPERKRTGKTALACILIISLLINILVILFLIHVIKERRNTPAPVPTSSPAASATVAPTPGADDQTDDRTDAPDEGQPGDEDSGAEGGIVEPTPGVDETPTPGTTPAPTPTPGATATPAPSEKPFWIDLDAHPELELKPNRESLYSNYVYYIVTADNLNVRSGPDTRYTKINSLSLGEKVGAVGKYGSWYLVAVGDKLGWVSGSYLTSNLNWKPETTPVPTQPPVNPTPTPPATEPPATEPPVTPPPTETPVPGGDSSSGDLNLW